jgi:hypothetical protein
VVSLIESKGAGFWIVLNYQWMFDAVGADVFGQLVQFPHDDGGVQFVTPQLSSPGGGVLVPTVAGCGSDVARHVVKEIDGHKFGVVEVVELGQCRMRVERVAYVLDSVGLDNFLGLLVEECVVFVAREFPHACFGRGALVHGNALCSGVWSWGVGTGFVIAPFVPIAPLQ